MIHSNEELESLLTRLERRFERLSDDTVLVQLGADQPPAALRISDPVLVAQAEIGPVPQDAAVHAALFRRLLELNASALVHAAYALTEDSIVLVAALELVSLDPNELSAVLSDFDLALSEHTPQLQELISTHKGRS